jgi:hypothetical protein
MGTGSMSVEGSSNSTSVKLKSAVVIVIFRLVVAEARKEQGIISPTQR